MSAAGPVALLGSLPAALGRQPGDELVIVGISRKARGVAVVLSVANDGDELVVDHAARQLLRDGATAAVVVSYSSDERRIELAATLLPTLGVRVLDVLVVHDGRWWSLACADPSCCPPEGTPLPTPPETEEKHHS